MNGAQIDIISELFKKISLAYENSTAAKNHSRRKKIAEFGQNLGQLIPGHTYDQDLDHVIHAPFRLFDQDHNRDHDKQV